MSALGRVGSRLVEPLWLGTALARARAVPAPERERFRTLAIAALRRAEAARALRHDEHDVAALSLERDAAALLLSALATIHAGHDGSVMAPSAAWATLDSLLQQKLLSDPPATLERTRELLASDDVLTLENLSPPRARAARAAVARTLSWLRGAIEARSERELRHTRVVRTSLFVLALGVLPFAGRWLLGPPNLAIYHPATASSLRSGGAPLGTLTDGTSKGAPVVTMQQDTPWLRVDLLDPATLQDVVVHLPAKQPSDMFPLVLELSDDDEGFAQVARLPAPPADRTPWRVPLAGRRARYVRLLHPGTGSLAVTELEVHGRK